MDYPIDGIGECSYSRWAEKLLRRRNYKCDLHKLSCSANVGNANMNLVYNVVLLPHEHLLVLVSACFHRMNMLNQHLLSVGERGHLLELRLQCISAPLSGS